ncbi:MAG: hypothetical protein AB7N76_28905 [Planctomycetota bacterium]
MHSIRPSTCLSLLGLLALTSLARADPAGRYDVAGEDLPAGAPYVARAELGALVGGRRAVRLERAGEPTLEGRASAFGGSLVLATWRDASPGIAGALSGAAGARTRWVAVLSPDPRGVAVRWYTGATLRLTRRERWTPAGAIPAAATPAAATPAAATSAAATLPALDASRPGEAAVLRLAAAARADGSIDAEEARDLAAFARQNGGVDPRIAGYLAALAADPAVTSDGAQALRRGARGERGVEVPLDNPVYRLVPGPSPFLEDDALYLRGDGRVSGDTGLRSHSRGYAAKRDGVLFTRHGSLAPAHPRVLTLDEERALRAQGPDAGLDRAAALGGVGLGPFTSFAATARSQAYYDPSAATPYWAGICQGWTHNALDERLSVLVDPPGPAGARGLWIFGQWLSRADLGNALMGASYSLGIADSVTIDSFVTPEKLVKALAQHVLRSGKGLRVDIWSDAHNPNGRYDPQIWNQPIVAGTLEVASVSSAVEAAVIAHARRAASFGPPPAMAAVKRVRATARWGAEANDEWEGEARFRSSEWNLYLVTQADGRVVRGYTAYELVAAGLTGLPVRDGDGLPDYVALPKHELTDAAFAGAAHRLLDPSNADGARFRFLVGTVLARGVPESVRAAFEAEALTPGADPRALAARYPGIANAYSPDHWARAFAPRLGAGADFGAVWGRASVTR